MMTPNELNLKIAALEAFKRVLKEYERFQEIYCVNIYYNGHNTTSHNSTDETSLVTKNALIAHWKRKLILEASNLRTFGVDPTSLMPEGVKCHD